MSKTDALRSCNCRYQSIGACSQLACAVQPRTTRPKPSVPERPPFGLVLVPRTADSISGPCARQSNLSDCITVQLTERPQRLIVRTPEACFLLELLL